MSVVVEGTTSDGEKVREEIETDSEELDLSENLLVAVDLSPLEKCTKLHYLYLSKNQLASVDLSPLENCTELQGLSLYHNLLAAVDLSPLEKCTKIEILYLFGNRLASVDLSPLENCTKLQEVILWGNQLASLDLSPLAQCTELQWLEFDSSTTIRWESPHLSIAKLPEGLQKYRQEIEQAWEEYTKAARERKEREEEERKRQEKVAAARLEESRSTKLRKILTKFQKISLERMGQLLQFEDSLALIDWLLDLPDEYGIQIDEETVLFTKDLRSGTEEAEAAINALLQSFEDFEKSGKGKV